MAAWASLSTDMNADGQLSLADAWLWLAQAFFLPGDGALWAVLTYAPGLARFLELGTASYGGRFSAVVSALAWPFAVLAIGAASSLVRDVDQSLTASIVHYYRGCLRRLRVLWTWLRCKLHALESRLRLRRREADSEVDVAELALEDLEVEALRSHAALTAVAFFTANDVSSALEIRRTRARALLEKLARLGLLERTFGTNDGEDGYRLSRAGRFVAVRDRIGPG